MQRALVYRDCLSNREFGTGTFAAPVRKSLKILFRRRNLWVTDTLQWASEARRAQPANPMWDSAASAFPVRSQLPFELVCPLR